MLTSNYTFLYPKNNLYSKPIKGLQGCGLGYCFSFNGKEIDKEGLGGGGSTYDYGFRVYNAQLGRFLSVDPLTKSYPWNSTYAFAENDVISCVDIDGLEKWQINDEVTLQGDIKRSYYYNPNLDPLKDGDGFVYKKENKIKGVTMNAPFSSTLDMSAMKRAKELSEANTVSKTGEVYVILRKKTSQEIINQAENNVPSIEPETPFSPDIIVTNKNSVITPPKPPEPKKEIVQVNDAIIWCYSAYKTKLDKGLYADAMAIVIDKITKDKGKVISIKISVISGSNSNHSIENRMLQLSLENKFDAKAKFDYIDAKSMGTLTFGTPADFKISLEYEKNGVKR